MIRKSNDDKDDNNSVATVRMSDESSSNSEDDDSKQETEDSDWETPQGITNVSTSISQPSVFDFELCDWCICCCICILSQWLLRDVCYLFRRPIKALIIAT